MLVNSTGSIKTTTGGICGDTGNDTPRYIYKVQGTSLDRILSSKRAYNVARSSREVVLLHNRNTIAEGVFYPSMNIGLDNRSILPPFFPVFRGEDTIFSKILRIYDTNALTGYLTHAIMHNPTKKRNYPPEAQYKCSLSTVEIVCPIALSKTDPPVLR